MIIYEHMLVGLTVSVLLICLGLIIGAMRKASAVLGSKPRKHQTFTSMHNTQETLKAIVRFAQQAGYKIPAIDESKGQLVLEESPTLTTWGFFFPISVSRQIDNTALIEVGIKSKAIQVGPIVSRRLENCVNGIKAMLFTM